MPEITLEQAQAFFDTLTTGEPPEGFTLPNLPTLTNEQVFTVIYLMQEFLHVVPDCYEMCNECHVLFDTRAEGVTVGDMERDFYEEIGISQQSVKTNEDVNLCSIECASMFWKKAK